jgi:hypothetical protein
MHDFCGGSINLLGPKNLPHLCTNDILISNQNPTSEVEQTVVYTEAGQYYYSTIRPDHMKYNIGSNSLMPDQL